MTKFSLLGIAAVAVYATLAMPAFAQQRVTHPVNTSTGGDWCANREPGNPFNKDEDYLGWSAWRARGGWDDHNDFNCGPSRVNRSGF
jgi:hypothetical protein